MKWQTEKKHTIIKRANKSEHTTSTNKINEQTNQNEIKKAQSTNRKGRKEQFQETQ
jgi:hypothetical protein